MKLKPSPTLIGTFIISSLCIGAAALLLFGGRNPLAKHRRVVVYFDESVTGVTRGSSVKMRGVYSGRVLSLTPRLSPEGNAAMVAVVCELAEHALTSPQGKPVDLSDSETLRGLIDKGLRARLKPAGLSGEYTVDLDFYDPRKYPAESPPAWARGATLYPAVPALKSIQGELLEDLEAALHSLRQADLGVVSREIGGGELKKTLRSIGDAASSVRRLADSLERNPSSILSGKKAPPAPK